MSTFRVFLARTDRPQGIWDWLETVVAPNAQIALGRAWEKWNDNVSYPVPPLSQCRQRVTPINQTFALAQGHITSGQEKFAASIKNKVSQLLGSQLDGEFHVAPYPAGFNYGITYGNNAYYNKATLSDLDTLIGYNETGQLQMTGTRFSTLYSQILGAVAFTFSSADEKLIQREETDAEAQIQSVITAYKNAGGELPDDPPFGGYIQYILDDVKKRYGSYEDLPVSLSTLRNAIADYVAAAQNAFRLQSRRYDAISRLEAAVQNAKQPSAQNGGQQVGADEFFVGYTPEKLPSVNQLLQDLRNDSQTVKMQISLSNFSSENVDFSVDGGTAFTVPIKRVLNIGFGARTSYDMSRYTKHSSKLTIDIEYKGVTFFPARPSPLSADNKTGWFANDILQEVVNKTGRDETGYKLLGSEYDPDELFGAGKVFGRLKTFVISQQPTMTFTFTECDEETLKQDFEAGSNVSVDLFGLFELGSASADYHVQKVESHSSSGSVTITFAPPEPNGTIPLEQQKAFVLGGVPSYPPNDR